MATDPRKMYSLSEAAKRAGISEDELRCAIKDGLLRAELMENVGQHCVNALDFEEYLQRSRRAPLTPGPRKRKVLIVDDEINFANIMKLELERDPRIEAKFTTWGRDGIRMAESYEPDLCLIDFMLPDTTGDQVLEAVSRNRSRKPCRVIVYSAHTRDAIQQNPNLEARLTHLGADEFMSKSAGMRALTVKVFELLGLGTNTKILRRQV